MAQLKFRVLILGLGVCTMASPRAFAQLPPNRTPVTATAVYVPVGYDANDLVTIVIEGYLESPCQQVRGATIEQDNHTFTVRPLAEVQSDECDPLPVPYKIEPILNPNEALAQGPYVIKVPAWDGSTLTEPLQIDPAQGDSINAHPYAPVDDASVGMLSNGNMRATIQGRFQSSCTELKEIRLGSKNDKTYELLPITRPLKESPDGTPCRKEERAYTAFKDFPEPKAGRYLLHVRTQSGTSINRVFTNIW